MERAEEFVVIIGASDRGKTTTELGIIKAILSAGERTIVIVPDQSEKAWYSYYPVINAEKLESDFDVNFTGIKILEYEDKVTFPFLYNLFEKGIIKDLNIVLDDPFYVEEGRPEKELMRIIKRKRQYSIDIFTTAHDFDNIPKAFFTYLTVFGLHYTSAPIINRLRQVSEGILRQKKQIDNIANVPKGHKNYHYKRLFKKDGTEL